MPTSAAATCDGRSSRLNTNESFAACTPKLRQGLRVDLAAIDVLFLSHWHNIWVEGAPAATMWPAQITLNHLAEAERQSMDIDPLSGEDLAKAVSAIIATPPATGI